MNACVDRHQGEPGSGAAAGRASGATRKAARYAGTGGESETSVPLPRRIRPRYTPTFTCAGGARVFQGADAGRADAGRSRLELVERKCLRPIDISCGRWPHARRPLAQPVCAEPATLDEVLV
jgi:hypothetical protein